MKTPAVLGRPAHFVSVLLACLLGLSLGLARPAQASEVPASQQFQASSQLLKLLEANQKYKASHGQAYFESIRDAQHPSITLMSCSDSRAHATAFVDDPINTVFSIRNIGNQIHNNFGSVDYGIQHLHTPILLILGHTHCGAIHAALHHYAAESFAIIREVDHLAVPLRDILPLSKGNEQDPERFEQLWNLAVQQNVDYQVQTALRRYSQEVAQGQLTIVGGVYDFTNAFGAGEGQLILSNLNGQTGSLALLQQPVLKNLPAALLQQAIRRLPPLKNEE